MSEKAKYLQVIDEKANIITDVSDKIWEYAELSLMEFKSCELYVKVLKEQGFIAYYQTADEDAAASVVYADVQGMDLETYKAELEKTEGVEKIEDLVVNGIPCVSYDMPEADTTCISFATEAGYILEFSFKPMSDEGFQSVVAYMGASIQPEETEEAAASEAESVA